MGGEVHGCIIIHGAVSGPRNAEVRELFRRRARCPPSNIMEHKTVGETRTRTVFRPFLKVGNIGK